MCRLTLQLLGMLGNVHGRPRHALQRPRYAYNVLGMLTTSLADLGMLLQGPRSPTSKRNPPTCCLISYESKGVVYHQVSYMEAWWYTTPLASHLIRQQVGEFLFNVGLLGPCKSMPRSAKDVASMPRTLQSMPRTAEDIAKHA